jgi:uncharacterized cupin superfamily protein
MTKPLFISAKEAKKIDVFGADIYLTMPQAAGRTEVSLLEATARPGDGPPLHVHHNEDEISRVVEGRYRLRIGGRQSTPAPGTRCSCPRALPHCYVNSGEVMGRLLFVVRVETLLPRRDCRGALGPRRQGTHRGPLQTWVP